jgi:hypothetical protein
MNVPVKINGITFVTVKQAAIVFGYSRDHLTRLAKTKKIVSTQLGRLWYVSELSLQNYLDDQRVEAAVRQNVLSKNRQAELHVHSALTAAKNNSLRLSQNAGKLAGVYTLLFFGLLLAAASQIVPSASVSVTSLMHTTQDLPVAKVEPQATQPVFTYDNTVVVSNSGRWVEKPEVTPQWVQITP